jgi:hypothetical protein
MSNITFVGFDVRKATVAGSGRDSEVRHLGRVENRPEGVRRLVERLRRGCQELRVGYEAGPSNGAKSSATRRTMSSGPPASLARS